MRVISGLSRGRKLKTPKGRNLRPTSDRVKESIFNILGKEVDGKAALDLFAGTGSLGIEALSRGASHVVFVEKGNQAVRLIEQNVAGCDMRSRSEIIQNDVHRAIGILERRRNCFDLIFMDPPYEKGLVRQTLRRLQHRTIYHQGSILVIEHDRREPLPEPLKHWTLLLQRRIGDTLVSILSSEWEEPSARSSLSAPED
jgi:16S rRNA (guanine(966)-N(2))-methyltransferase RsmD